LKSATKHSKFSGMIS